MGYGRFSALAALCLLAMPAAAQTADAPAAADPAVAASCELHVWPGSNLNSVYYGWFHGGINNGAVNGRDGYPKLPPDPLNTTAQLALLERAQPQQALKLEGYRLVIHPEALESRVIRTSTTRLGGSDSSCYAELIVDDVFLQQDVFAGNYLKTLFRFRDFGPDQAPRRVFGSWVATKLFVFPPKTPAELDAAASELGTAYVANFALFGTALNKPPKRRR